MIAAARAGDELDPGDAHLVRVVEYDVPDVLPATLWRALADGAARDVALIVGQTRDEHRLFSLIDGVLGQVAHEQTETALHMLAPRPGRRTPVPGGTPCSGR
jgi:carboxylesterase type B